MLGTKPSNSTSSSQLRPGISVLIRTYNSARTLEDVLKRLPMQEHDELIVVDSGSTDSTIFLARSFHARIVQLDLPFNYSAALNRGFEVATNDWVLVISSHVIPQDENLVARVRDFASIVSDDFVVAYGKTSLIEEAQRDSTSEAGYDVFEGSTLSNTSGNRLAVYKKAVWQKRHFRENLRTAEDLDWFLWAREAGYKVAKINGLSGLYRNQGSLSHMFRKGWSEVRQANFLIPHGQVRLFKRLRGLMLGTLHLLKLCIIGKLPVSSMLRQQSHLFGAFVAHSLASR